MQYAIDRQRFVDVVLQGFGGPLALPWRPGSLAYEPAKRNPFPFDLDRAKALLSESGLSPIELDMLTYPGYPELSTFAQLYQADLAKIGIKLNIKAMESAVFFDMVNSRKYSGVYGTGNGAYHAEAVSLLVGRGYDPTGNNSAFKSETYTNFITAASVEPDVAKRKAIYSQINDNLLDEAFALGVANITVRQAASAAVKGVGFYLHDAFHYTDTWLDR